ncbi:MAG: PBP1A family penicillin-binding protein [Chloroflexi bacterium]|nr:PBP1A family penicillin-binding protein [Chloroflexota bacterium]
MINNGSTLPQPNPDFNPPSWQARLRALAERHPRLAHTLTLFGIATVALLCVALTMLVLAFNSFTATLPSPDRLANFLPPQSTKIFDRRGELLFEVFDSHGGRRTNVPIEKIPAALKNATITTEDQTFYSNIGVDFVGIARAIYNLIRYGRPAGGGSTITQQLVKTTLLSPEQTIERKVREAFLAYEITRRYSKDKILELYLNTIFYGNLAYGVQAAADAYFDKDVQDLSLAQAALLAGLPQAPALYDPCVDADAALDRTRTVLNLMVAARVISREESARAAAEIFAEVNSDAFARRCQITASIQAPHFVAYVRQLLEEQYGSDVVYKAGLQVTTSLDLDIQKVAEDEARKQVALLQSQKVTNASVVVLDPRAGEILALLGSVDFFDKKIDGQVNVALRLRQPGSSIKPINYVAAFEKGWTPATVLADVTTIFPIKGQPDYVPHNYDQREHGLTPIRVALASSFNIPAVKTLQFVTVPTMIETAKRFGITTFRDASNYGLALTLGGGEVKLLELTGAYAAFANNGARFAPSPFLKITDAAGKVLYDVKANPPRAERPVDPRYAYQITSILSDVSARAPAFGTAGALRLSRTAAVKTGTTDDFRDNWTIGFAPNLAVGVWVGNSNNAEMEHISGITGAGPIWHNIMERILAGTPALDFKRPDGLVDVEICNESGLLPTENCPRESRRVEIFLAERAPKEKDNVWQKLKIDKTNGMLGNAGCPPENVEEKIFAVYPPEARQWAIDHNIPQPPTDVSPNCPDPILLANKPSLDVATPREGEILRGEIEIRGTVRLPDFDRYTIQIGPGNDPRDWILLTTGRNTVQNNVLARWDTRRFADGAYTIRLEMFDRAGKSFAGRVHVAVANTPTITPRPQPTATRTNTPAPTATRTLTPLPTFTLTASPTRTISATTFPSATVTRSATLPPTATIPPPTITLAPTATISPTLAPTATASPTIAPTSTATPPASPTATPSPTRTISPTVTRTPTP